MKLRQLEMFIAVMREGTATGAAAALHTTQPNVTKVIKQLEHEFGLRLFERSGGRLHATPEAAALFETAQQVRDEFSELERKARALSRLRAGYLRIATQPTYSNVILPPALAEFRRRYPDVQVRIDVLGRETIARLPERAAIDLAFVHFMDEPPPEVAFTIACQPMICIMPPDHPLSRRPVVRLSEAMAHPRVGFPSDHISTRLIARALDRPAGRLSAEITVNYTSLAADLVRQGSGLSIVEPLSFHGNPTPGLELRPLAEPLMFKTGIARPSGRTASVAAQAFTDLVRELLPSEPLV